MYINLLSDSDYCNNTEDDEEAEVGYAEKFFNRLKTLRSGKLKYLSTGARVM